MNKNKMAICGTKTAIPSIPGMMAPATISLIGPSGNKLIAFSSIQPNKSSTIVIKGADQV